MVFLNVHLGSDLLLKFDTPDTGHVALPSIFMVSLDVRYKALLFCFQNILHIDMYMDVSDEIKFI